MEEAVPVAGYAVRELTEFFFMNECCVFQTHVIFILKLKERANRHILLPFAGRCINIVHE